MSIWTPEWKVTINGGLDYTNLTIANLIITSGRTDIYSQPAAGYCSVSIMNLDVSAIPLDINDGVAIQVKDSTGAYVTLFGGNITDLDVLVNRSGNVGITQIINIKALGALSKLTRIVTDGVLSKENDGDQIASVLGAILFDTWSETPPALTWATYPATTTWANAGNSGYGEIDQPGDYELTARTTDPINVYSLVSGLATSGLGYLYENSLGQISYADSTHRSQYLAANGYTIISANSAVGNSLKISKRSGDVRNQVEIIYKDGHKVKVDEAESQSIYGILGSVITTTIEKLVDATFQANFYLALRAFPRYLFKTISYPLGSPELSDNERDALLNVNMGLALDITDLPANMVDGRFQGFVEGWTFTASVKGLNLSLNLTPISYSLQAMKWEDVPITETFNTLIPTLDWNDATIVA